MKEKRKRKRKMRNGKTNGEQTKRMFSGYEGEKGKKKTDEKQTGKGEKENKWRERRKRGEKKMEFFPVFRQLNLDGSRVKVDPHNEGYS